MITSVIIASMVKPFSSRGGLSCAATEPIRPIAAIRRRGSDTRKTSRVLRDAICQRFSALLLIGALDLVLLVSFGVWGVKPLSWGFEVGDLAWVQLGDCRCFRGA